MKILFIGGTGNISGYCAELAVQEGHDVYMLNRGLRGSAVSDHVKQIICDIRNCDDVRTAIGDKTFDVVADFIAFVPSHVNSDIDLFSGKCAQYIFISTATVYNKPPVNFPVTESTPLKNPYWKYSQDKIACEEILMNAFREINFPVTVIRPSHTYGKTMIPGIFGHGDYTEIARIKAGKEIIVQGDGQTLWTLTHASDFACGFLGLCGNRSATGESFHITSDELLSWDEIMRIKAEAVGSAAKIVHIPSEFIDKMDPETGSGLLGDKQYNAIFDNRKIKTFVPSFQAKTPFRKGLAASLDFYHSTPEKCVETPQTSQLIDKILNAYKR